MAHEHGFALFGLVTACALALAVLAVASVLLAALIMHYFPRFHIGRPKNTLTLQTHSSDQILTSKTGGLLEPKEPRLIQKLGVKWWMGMSSRNKASWFFGLLITPSEKSE